MIKKLFMIFNFLILTGCTSLINYTTEIPQANIIRKENSQLAVVSTEYAGKTGIKVTINNKTDRIVEILWSKSNINGKKLALSDENFFKNRNDELDDEWLLPNDVYSRVLYVVRKNNEFTSPNLEYPRRLEILFRNKVLNNKAVLIITKVDLFGNIIDY